MFSYRNLKSSTLLEKWLWIKVLSFPNLSEQFTLLYICLNNVHCVKRKGLRRGFEDSGGIDYFPIWWNVFSSKCCLTLSLCFNTFNIFHRFAEANRNQIWAETWLFSHLEDRTGARPMWRWTAGSAMSEIKEPLIQLPSSAPEVCGRSLSWDRPWCALHSPLKKCKTTTYTLAHRLTKKDFIARNSLKELKPVF